MNIHQQTIIEKTWNSAKNVFDYSFTFAFQTRDRYLEFRRQWKEHYALLGTALRAQKRRIRDTMRAREHAGEQQVKLLSLKSDATVQLALLRSAKHEGNRQYLAAKELEGKRG